MSRTFVATREDGSQILVAVSAGGAHIAERPNPWATWGPPLDVEER